MTFDLLMQIKPQLMDQVLMNASIQRAFFITYTFILLADLFAQIAQLVEQRTENPRVTGSIPVLGTIGRDFYFMVEVPFIICYCIVDIRLTIRRFG